MDTFERALQFTLAQEGGYVNDPKDPGGETNCGISKRYHPAEDIANLTRDRAAQIYRAEYWDVCRCNDMPPLIARAVFDAAVNMGCTRSIKILQTAVGAIADGVIGPDTLLRVRSLDVQRIMGGDNPKTLLKMLKGRSKAYASMPDFPRFGAGWLARVIALAFDLHEDEE